MSDVHRPLRKLGQRLLELEAETATRCLEQIESRRGLAADALARVASHAHETLENPPRFARQGPLDRASGVLRRSLAGIARLLWPARRTATEDVIDAIAAVRGGIETVMLIELLADSAEDAGLRRWCEVWLERRRAAAFVSEAELRAGLTATHVGRARPRLARGERPQVHVSPHAALASAALGHPSLG